MKTNTHNIMSVTYKHACAFICMHTHIYTHIYIHVYIYFHHTATSIHIYMYTCTHTHVHIHVYIYMYIYTCCTFPSHSDIDRPTIGNRKEKREGEVSTNIPNSIQNNIHMGEKDLNLPAKKKERGQRTPVPTTSPPSSLGHNDQEGSLGWSLWSVERQFKRNAEGQLSRQAAEGTYCGLRSLFSHFPCIHALPFPLPPHSCPLSISSHRCRIDFEFTTKHEWDELEWERSFPTLLL